VELQLHHPEISHIRGMSVFRNIRVLDLSDTGLDDDGLPELAVRIERMPEFALLDLRGTKLTTEGLAALTGESTPKPLQLNLSSDVKNQLQHTIPRQNRAFLARRSPSHRESPSGCPQPCHKRRDSCAVGVLHLNSDITPHKTTATGRGFMT